MKHKEDQKNVTSMSVERDLTTLYIWGVGYKGHDVASCLNLNCGVKLSVDLKLIY